ncbi:hypothetical protein BYT27DRAFT_7128587 [Phlegmacium glaucopus]|nr:hypothetical protein BYT27DRAFT_7128587 [Phlegmacium glaucopus]
MQADQRRPQPLDTFDLRDQIHSDDHQNIQAHVEATMNYGTDDEHSVLEDDSEAEDGEDYIEEDDMSSTLSIPNESIDFDMVYAFHSFAATVEGQANVVKGDSLYLMDDTNSYWWLVRVLKTQEVGYIPAENIETPFERLARLNKHRNIDLALPTQEEQDNPNTPRGNTTSRTGHQTPSPHPPNTTGSRENQTRNVHFTSIRSQYRYIPPLREGEIEEEDDEWDVHGFEDEDLELAAEQMYMQSMEEDDGMQWDEDVSATPIPDALQPGSLRELKEQQNLRVQQQQQLQLQLQQKELAAQERQPQQQAIALEQVISPEQATQLAIQAQQQVLQQQQRQALPTSSSREVLSEESSSPRRADPAEATETLKVTVTPSIAREYDERPVVGQQPYPPRIVIEKQQDDERTKRMRDDEPPDESLKKAKGKEKMAAPVSSTMYNKPTTAKLRKVPSKDSKETTDDEGKDKKKKGSMFGGLFGRRKEKGSKEAKGAGSASITSVESEYTARDSEDSGKSGPRPPPSDGTTSPTTTVAQQQQQALGSRSPPPPENRAATQQVDQLAPSTPERSTTPQVSQHASQLRQRDQQQQALYQQYLNRSPSSPPETQPSYGLQSVSAVMLSSPPSSSALGPPASRPRPGSLILTSPQSSEAQNLSVIRVFAGRNLQTEATFKTVLLNPSTTASDLVRQAIQRFRLPSAEVESDYYLTIKQVEGGAFAVLDPKEHPLVVFDNLVVEATELPKVKRSSVGSISSVSSNLSMLPAIKKLSMNDFTDDSAVKFYLNRRGDGNPDDSMNGHEGDDTLIAASLDDSLEIQASRPQQYPSISPQGPNVTPERFTSPSIRFPLQLVIYAEDLPEDMQFHPTTEAIVYKNALPDPSAPVVVSPNLRRKVFMYPKNVTVAEVTELGLERFGIQDGVIDGGDEVEDKMTKRRSVSRVRYGLMISVDGQERELSPSSKIIDAFPRPPQYRTPDRQASINKRRSLDAGQLLGSIDDVRPDDPVFVLRRATAYRNSTSRRRSSAPLDEIALQHLHMHRESTSSYNSDAQAPIDEGKLKQPSRQEIIAAQRAATRATQRAIVSAQYNSVRGMDVLLPGNSMLRSSRYNVGDRMRYSYVEPDGESYDISDVVEQEWRDLNTTNKHDLLEGVFNRNKDGISEKLDRFLHKIRKGKGKEKDLLSVSSADSHQLSFRSLSPSEYSTNDAEVHSRSITPGSAALTSRMPSGNVQVEAAPAPAVYIRPLPSTKGLTSDDRSSRPGTTTPTGNTRSVPVPSSRRNLSVTSVISDNSGRNTPVHSQPNLHRVEEERVKDNARMVTPRSQQRWPVIPKDDFGHAHMMAIIEYKGLRPKQPTVPLDPVDELLFGAPLDLDSLHPLVREIYASGFKQLEEMDKLLDTYIRRSAVGAF